MTGRHYLALTLALLGGMACDLSRPFRAVDDARPVLSVTMTPDSATGRPGDTVTFSATPNGAGGRAVSEAPIAWAVGDPSVARPLGNGRIVCQATGTSEVLATAGGRRGVARVRCRP